MNETLFWIYLSVLLIVDLLVAATRASFLNSRYPSLLIVKEQKGLKISKTLELLSHRSGIRAAFQFTQAILRLWLAGLVLLNLPFQLHVWVFLVLAVVLWLIEFSIENWILRNPELWAIRLMPVAAFIRLTITPLLYLPLRLAHVDEEEVPFGSFTEDELISMVEASEEAGEIEKDESEMIQSVFEFGDTISREIMVPRVDVLFLEVDTPLEDAADRLLKSGYSRVPVYEKQIDNVIGMLYTKDMLKVWRSGDQITSLKTLLREVHFVPETKKVDDLLDEMQAQRIHIALVVDEYGGVAGLVTLEDIIEEIFGEIQDEYDQAEEALYVKVSEDEYIFSGKVLISEVNQLLSSHIPEDVTDTLGGLIYTRLGGVPKRLEEFTEEDVILKVIKVGERRIHQVQARRVSEKAVHAGKEEKHD